MPNSQRPPRRSLDAALDAFAQRVAEAQGRMNGNPEIAAYVQAAQKLQETTRQLTDDLIRRQEQQFARLMDLRQRLNEQMEQRRVELWQNDKPLQDLTERMAILTRQYNAAIGGGLQKEAENLKVDIDLTRNLIKARQELLPGDSFYADAVRQLQVIIDSTKQNIDDDRKKTEQLLTSLQQSFTSHSGQSVEKLPEEQKQLAEALQKQLSQINAARGSATTRRLTPAPPMPMRKPSHRSRRYRPASRHAASRSPSRISRRFASRKSRIAWP